MAEQGQPNTILGSPYVEVPDMPDEGANATSIVFGDVRRAYTITDRIQLSVLRDPFTQATAGNIRFIARRRVGGQVVLAEAIAKLKCELIDRTSFRSHAVARMAVFEFIEGWYNPRRRHSSIGYLLPIEYDRNRLPPARPNPQPSTKPGQLQRPDELG